MSQEGSLLRWRPPNIFSLSLDKMRHSSGEINLL